MSSGGAGGPACYTKRDYKIHVEVTADSYEAAVASFRSIVKNLEDGGYRVGTNWAGGGIGGTQNVFVTSPKQAPLNDGELHHIRQLLKR